MHSTRLKDEVGLSKTGISRLGAIIIHAFILASVIDVELAKTTASFWLFIKTFIYIMAFILAIKV